MLADVRRDDLTTLRICIGENILHKIVSKLVPGDVDERHARTLWASFADTIEVAIQEVRTTDLQALLDDLRSELIHAVLSCEADDVVDSASAVWD